MSHAQRIEDLKDTRANAMAVVKRVVNEGAVARAAIKLQRVGPSPIRAAYMPIVRDWADAVAAVDAEPEPWRPDSLQIDFADRLELWLGKRHVWEWRLLEFRGWQTMFGKPSWRSLADKLNPRHDGPMFSHEGWRQTHAALVDEAFRAAINDGYVSC